MEQLAVACRYGHQSYMEITGRRMSVVDFQLFSQCLIELYNHEVKPSEVGLPPGEG
jgi:hypothetical protein